MLGVRSGYGGLLAFAEAIDQPLEPFMKRIARAHFGREREVVVIIPRGNFKTTLAALLGLHHLLTVPNAAVTIGAASTAQANICYKRMQGFARHPVLRDHLEVLKLELRFEVAGETGKRVISVVPAAGEKAHGLSSSLYIGDEIWAWSDEGLLDAMLTGLIKNPAARFLGISTAAPNLDTPLGRMRARALAGKVTRKPASPVFEAINGGLRWLEWSLADGTPLDDFRAVKAVNPAAYITQAALREQHRRVQPVAFAQFHCCRWGSGSAESWLPPGAWQAAVGAPEFEPGEDVWVGVDLGGSRSSSAVVWVNASGHVGCAVYEGDGGPREAVARVRELARELTVREVVFDPWRFAAYAASLSDEGVLCVEFPQTAQRMCPASETLHRAVTDRELVLPADPVLAQQSAKTIAKASGRGWRIDKANPRDHNDAIVALAMAFERSQAPAPMEPQFVGWLGG